MIFVLTYGTLAISCIDRNRKTEKNLYIKMSTKSYIHDITETDTRTTFTTGAGADETVVLYATAVFVTTTTTTAVVVVVVGLHTRAVRVLRAGNGSAYETVSVKGLTWGRGEVSAVQSHAHTRSKTGGRTRTAATCPPTAAAA